jgi:DNA topoisomerase-1
MMQEFYDKFHPTKDVEANAEREWRKNFRKDPKQESRFCSFRKFTMAQIGEADDEEKNSSLMPDQNIGNITLEEALNLFCFQKI